MSLLLSKGARISGRRTRNESRPREEVSVLILNAGRIGLLRAATTVTAVVLMAGCAEEPIEPDDTPPDLSGSYTLVSFYVPAAGDTLRPPAVGGTFRLAQTSVVGQEASGTMDTLSITFPGGSQNARGTYTNRFDGSWEQEFLTGFQALGTYSVQGNTLTVVVTQPALAVSTTVWRK